MFSDELMQSLSAHNLRMELANTFDQMANEQRQIAIRGITSDPQATATSVKLHALGAAYTAVYLDHLAAFFRGDAPKKDSAGAPFSVDNWFDDNFFV